MPILFNPGAFKQKPGLLDALGDAGTAGAQASGMMMEAALAKAKLDGWKEARELDKKRLALFEQDQAFQVEDRALQAQNRAESTALAGAEAGLQQFGLGKPQLRAGVEQAGAAVGGALGGPMGMVAQAGIEQAAGPAIDDVEASYVREQAKKLSPGARAAFVQSYIDGRKREVIQREGASLRASIQDTLIGFARTPEAEPFSEPLQALAAEADILDDEGIGPEDRARIAGDIRAELGKLKTAARAKTERDRTDLAAIEQIDKMLSVAPPGSPMWMQLNAMKIAIEFTEVKGSDLLRSFTAGGQMEQRGQVQADTQAHRAQQLERSDRRIDISQQNADTSKTRTESQIAQGDARIKIAQQNADTAASRAGASSKVSPKQRADMIGRRIQQIQGGLSPEILSAKVDEIRQMATKQIDEELSFGGMSVVGEQPQASAPPAGFMEDYEKLSEAEKAKARAAKPEWFQGGS
jgi:hypothetical protein